MTKQVINALGLMSGTSLDGVDVVRVATDGEALCNVEGRFYLPYPAALRERLLHVARGDDTPLADVLRLERELTELYAKAVAESKLAKGVQVIGCHGQTIRHIPAEGLTWQLGDPNVLAERTGVPVVMDFRRRDVAAGGQGAPLAPLFHAMMMSAVKGKWAVLNIGGVANITYGDGKQVIGGDTGPGVGLLNSFVKARTGAEFDEDGKLALAGTPDMELAKAVVAQGAFWKRKMPRSADRYEFVGVLERLSEVSTEDGAATLAALTAEGVRQTLADMKVKPGDIEGLYVAGGGAQNPALLRALDNIGLEVKDLHVETGWLPQDVEAACFAWLAARRLRGLTTTLPTTTGCAHATVGGVLTA